mgnify:FL=1
MQATLEYNTLCHCRNEWLAAGCDALRAAHHVQAELIQGRIDDITARIAGLYARRTQELRLVNLSPDTGEYTHDPRD